MISIGLGRSKSQRAIPEFHISITTLTGSIYRKMKALTICIGNDPVTGGSVGSGNATGTIANPCDLCFIKNLQFQAASPYYNGPLLADQSVYESKTSSCGVTGMPLTTTDLTFYT